MSNLFDHPFRRRNTLRICFAPRRPQIHSLAPPPPICWLPPPSNPLQSTLAGVFALSVLRAPSPLQSTGSCCLRSAWPLSEPYRRRSEWNDRFAHWERSDAETQRIERARNMVQQALGKNRWLSSEGARIVPQGSFTNRTNTRLDADIDLRVQHPSLKIEYGYGVDVATAYRQGGYYSKGVSFGYASDRMRAEIRSELTAAFGALAVDDSGNKAIRVKGFEGGRSEVDVVPCFTLHHITGLTLLGQTTVPGTAILSLKNQAN